MNSIIRKSILSVGAVLLFAGAAGRAEASELMNVKVPFQFTVNGHTMPAGNYVVRRDDLDPSVMRIQGTGPAHTNVAVLTNMAGGQDPAGDKPCLSFSRTGTQYQLSRIWESGTEGHAVLGNE
jgi:hypothetical protein